MTDLDLAAPCGVYCGSCRHYLVMKKKLEKEKGLKKGCEGCRKRNRKCAFIKRDCLLIRNGEVAFCFECKKFPCPNLKKLDARHKKSYGDSPIANLIRIKKVGPEKWLLEQEKLYTCPKCKGELSVQDDECYDCGHGYNPYEK